MACGGLSARHQHGFTLLEVMVATLIMAIAVVGVLSQLRGSLANTAELTTRDRATQFARHRLDEQLARAILPDGEPLSGPYLNGGWSATATPFEYPPNPTPGMPILQQVEVRVWWTDGEKKRQYALDGYRRTIIGQEEAATLDHAGTRR